MFIYVPAGGFGLTQHSVYYCVQQTLLSIVLFSVIKHAWFNDTGFTSK